MILMRFLTQNPLIVFLISYTVPEIIKQNLKKKTRKKLLYKKFADCIILFSTSQYFYFGSRIYDETIS